MKEAVYDDGIKNRLHVHMDGSLELERFEEGENHILTPEESMDVATTIINRNIEEPTNGERVYWNNCEHAWPDFKCKRLIERPEFISKELIEDGNLIIEPADCRKVNSKGACGYYDDRKEKRDGSES